MDWSSKDKILDMVIRTVKPVFHFSFFHTTRDIYEVEWLVSLSCKVSLGFIQNRDTRGTYQCAYVLSDWELVSVLNCLALEGTASTMGICFKLKFPPNFWGAFMKSEKNTLERSVSKLRCKRWPLGKEIVGKVSMQYPADHLCCLHEITSTAGIWDVRSSRVFCMIAPIASHHWPCWLDLMGIAAQQHLGGYRFLWRHLVLIRRTSVLNLLTFRMKDFPDINIHYFFNC